MNVEVERCVVPNCNNPATTGITFPAETNVQKNWLKSLNILHFIPSPNSFVCLDHFNSINILEDDQKNELENILEELPTPVLIQPSLQPLLYVDPKYHNSESESQAGNKNFSICRLCMKDEDVNINVFEKLEKNVDNITIAAAITQCIPLIKVTNQDFLSKFICNECLNTIKLFHKFRVNCLLMDAKQRELLPTKPNKRKIQDNKMKRSKNQCYAVTADKKATSEVDKKFDRVEAELLKALEGKLPEEMKSADNIIIEVHNDDEDSTMNVAKINSDQLILPKGIKVSINQARTGLFDSRTIKGMNNSEFCLADNYLFEYRLCKGNMRQLKCLVNQCPAIARQTICDSGLLSTKARVIIAHNHPPPSFDEKKRQMFLHVMHRKMQSDKSLNFRSVYEDFCMKDPELRKLVPLKTVVSQICCQKTRGMSPIISSFEDFFDLIENERFQCLHFTHSNKQFYQEKFTANDGSQALVFANRDTIEDISSSKIMYVDSSFTIDTKENFKYYLVSALVWINDSYYPILFALINEKSSEIYKAIFGYLHDILAPQLRPDEIVTDYEASLYYSLGEIYLESHIGGSVFYYTQNLYKKICSLNLSRELETNSCFRNIYHMILMLPLLPVNTILDGLNNIEQQATELGCGELTAPIFEHVRSEWMSKVTPDLFCVHRLENRINENVIAPFKKLRDLLMLSRGKTHKPPITIVMVVEKLIELEGFLQGVYAVPSKKSFARDLSSSQKKNVIRAWHFIESHPKININNFFNKVLGYIKCMENQLWIWGFYRYIGDAEDDLINAANFSIVGTEDDHDYERTSECDNVMFESDSIVVDVVIDEKSGLLEDTGMEEPMTVDRSEEFENIMS